MFDGMSGTSKFNWPSLFSNFLNYFVHLPLMVVKIKLIEQKVWFLNYLCLADYIWAYVSSWLNSQAVGWDSWVPSALKIDFLGGTLILKSAAWFFVIILIFIFTLIFQIQILKKKFLDIKKISFSKANFLKSHI